MVLDVHKWVRRPEFLPLYPVVATDASHSPTFPRAHVSHILDGQRLPQVPHCTRVHYRRKLGFQDEIHALYILNLIICARHIRSGGADVRIISHWQQVQSMSHTLDRFQNGPLFYYQISDPGCYLLKGTP